MAYTSAALGRFFHRMDRFLDQLYNVTYPFTDKIVKPFLLGDMFLLPPNYSMFKGSMIEMLRELDSYGQIREMDISKHIMTCLARYKMI